MKKRLAILLLVPLLLIFTPKESIAKVLDDQIDYNLSVITEYDCDLNIDKHIASIYASGGGNANTKFTYNNKTWTWKKSLSYY